MGEIKIKSGNLFDINGEHTSLVWDGKECLIIENDAIIVNQIRPGYMTGIYYDEVYKPGTYTFAMKQLAAQSDKTAISFVSSAPFAGGAYNNAYKAYTAALVKHDDTHYITIVVTESTEIGFFINGYFSVNDKIYNIQLLEGTYTSETIPEYQPYFLNRPAHRYTNGQWVDIPTHHFINNRWQGELTSQSPLKFWADGNMLDWRVEGRTSGNLFNPETSTLVYLDVSGVEHPSEKSLTSDYISVNANTWYTLGQTGDIDSINDLAYCFYNSNKEFISSGTYTPSANGNIIRLLTPNDCAYFRFTYNHLRELVEFVEGRYNTIPPYEPYGGVGDWDETAQKYRIPVTVNGVTTTLYTDHQLMDGDSIDYATDQTAIPIATGNNVLTVDTAVQPSKVFVKFEG